MDISRKVTTTGTSIVRLVAQSSPQGYLVVIRLVERRQVEAVAALLPPPPRLEDALQEVKAQVSRGKAYGKVLADVLGTRQGSANVEYDRYASVKRCRCGVVRNVK